AVHPVRFGTSVIRGRVILEVERNGSDTGIGYARLIARLGRLDEGVMQPDGHGAAVGRSGAHQRTRRIRGVRQRDLNVRVPRESLRPGEIDGASAEVKLVVALIGAAKQTFDVYRIAQKQRARIDDELAVLFRFDGQRGADAAGARF